ncbi:uncharacterized protein [Diabrotica undecimpunctata]|uniref:uncharacterized protein n=1 Tax=Diabrotica undecimpunctata TaxID=50387 RepID=UPI003B63D879
MKSEMDTLLMVKNKTVEATGISVRTVSRILQESKRSLDNKNKIEFSLKRPLRKSPVTDLPEYQITDIRRIIHDFHRTENCRVTVNKLKNKIERDLDIKVSEASLRRILRNMNFRWRRARDNRKLLVEKAEIRTWKIKYLRLIKHYRNENRPIVYLDETYVHSGHTLSKTWNDNFSKGLLMNISNGQRLIIVHAGGEMGFIPNALLIFKSGSKSGDYHLEMNTTNYRKWLKEKLIPNLLPHSVIVCDNASYHSVYEFDELLREYGHTPLRLPLYHPDLNPIELIWAAIKNNIAQTNITFKLEDVRQLLEKRVSEITPDEWRKRCHHAIKIEDSCLTSEVQIDRQEDINPIMINLGSDDSDSECSSEEN